MVLDGEATVEAYVRKCLVHRRREGALSSLGAQGRELSTLSNRT